MKAAQEPDNIPVTIDVIVRAYKDEPVKLVAVARSGRDGSIVEVTKDGHGLSLLLTIGYVYTYDDAVYSALRAAYDSGSDTLQSLWKSAQRITVPQLCNLVHA